MKQNNVKVFFNFIHFFYKNMELHPLQSSMLKFKGIMKRFHTNLKNLSINPLTPLNNAFLID